MRAEEARGRAIASLGKVEQTLDAIRIRSGEGYFTLTVPQEQLDDESASHLKELGYYVSYNSPCLWWNISW